MTSELSLPCVVSPNNTFQYFFSKNKTAEERQKAKLVNSLSAAPKKDVHCVTISKKNKV